MEVCGGVLRNMSGSITAPDFDFDGRYDKNANCYWTIEAVEGHVIRYRITYLMIEPSMIDDSCSHDYLLVRYPKLS